MTLLKALEALSQFAGSSPTKRAQDQLNQVARRVSFEMIGCPSISRRLLSDATSEHSFGCSAGTQLPSRASLGRKTPSRRTELWPGLEVPLDASEIEDFRPDKVGEPHLIYCSPKVRRTPDMDQEHKSTTLSAVECCPSLEP